MENSFGEPLWGTGLKHSSFGATALRRCFGEQLWEAAAGNRFGEQLWPAFRNKFAKHCFEEQQLWGAVFSKNFGEQLSGAALENSFGELLWGTGLKHSSFGATALRRRFGEQLWEAAANDRFG